MSSISASLLRDAAKDKVEKDHKTKIKTVDDSKLKKRKTVEEASSHEEKDHKTISADRQNPQNQNQPKKHKTVVEKVVGAKEKETISSLQKSPSPGKMIYEKKKRTRKIDLYPWILPGGVKAIEAFLSSGPLHNIDYHLEKLMKRPEKWVEHIIFKNLANQNIKKIACAKPKTLRWKRSRMCRVTGTGCAPAVGHSSYGAADPISTVNKMCTELMALQPYDGDEEKETRIEPEVSEGSFYRGAMDWGSGKEGYAKQGKLDAEHKAACEACAEKSQDLEFFTYRGVQIPRLPNGQDPEVMLCDFALIVDPDHPHTGNSPDSILVVNGVPICVMENKCSFAQEKRLHSIMRPGNWDQVQSGIYITSKHWPTIRFCDYINWSPQGWTSEMVAFDPEYWLGWYKPREHRYYFQLLLPQLAMTMWNKFLQSWDATRRSESKYSIDPRKVKFDENLKIELENYVHSLLYF
jgi:hypothetical protein